MLEGSNMHLEIGQEIHAGDKIGEMGRTGRYKSSNPNGGYHLHFEIWLNGNPLNPLNQFPIFEKY